MNLEANREATQELYRQIAEELASLTRRPWRHEPRPENGERSNWFRAFLTCDGRRFELYPEWRKGERIQVSGRYPDGKTNRNTDALRWLTYMKKIKETPQISCAASRGATAIARDIQSRFLTPFQAAHDAIVAKLAEMDDYDARCVALRQRLIDAIDGAGPWHDAASDHISVPQPYHEIRAQAGDAGDDTCRISLWSVPTELALKVIRAVEDWREENPTDEAD